MRRAPILPPDPAAPQDAAALLCDLLGLRDYNRAAPARTLARARLRAAAWLVSRSAAARLLTRGPSRESLRKALPATADGLLARSLPALHARLPAALRRRSDRKGLRLAVDGHQRPFY